MTVCVAAFAAKSEAIVLISDKAVTLGQMMSDTTICKMSRLGETPWYALIAGEISTADEMNQRSEQSLVEMPSLADSVVDMMKLTAKAYQDAYDGQLEAKVFAPKLLSKADVYQRPRRLHPLAEKLTDTIEEDRKQFERDWSCELLICGFDAKDQCHIFRVSGGRAIGEDRSGYSAIGIGADAAIGRLMFLESDRGDDLGKVLWDAFDAKVQGEQMLSVGYKWDAHILLKDKPLVATEVPKEIHDLMDKAMNRLNVSQFDFNPWEPHEIPPDDWRQQVMRFTETLIPTKIAFDESDKE